MNDIVEALKLLNSHSKNRIGNFKIYDSIYPFTNENIKEYMPNLENNNVLTVVGSGDQYLNSILNGANNVDCFDINKLSIYLLKLKKAAIEQLDIEQFKRYFSITDDENTLKYDIYAKFKNNLDDNTLKFWDTIYRNFNNNGDLINNTNLFSTPYSSKFDYKRLNSYLNEQNYLILKVRLKNIKNINFINTEIHKLKNYLEKEYDFMFFSNISDYVNSYDYMYLVTKLEDNLKENGKIYFSYLYNYACNYMNNEYLETLKKLQIHNYNEVIINGVFNETIQEEDIYADKNINKDKILVYNKRK